MLESDAALIIFAKTPLPGQVKTRIARVKGKAIAQRLAKTFISNTLAKVNRVDIRRHFSEIVLWFTPSSRHPVFLRSKISQSIRYKQQVGADLGLRMHHAIRQALKTHKFAVVIGTDCPSLNSNYIAESLTMLAEGNDVVFGPADDGGYVLIATRVVNAQLFRNIHWGGSRVLSKSLETCRRLGFRSRCLDTLVDIDRVEDMFTLK